MTFLVSFIRVVQMLGLGLLLAADASAQANSPAGSRSKVADGEIVEISRALNQGEVVTSEPALTKATSAEVKQFAQMMIDDHTKALQKIEQLAQQNQLAAKPNEIASTLQDTAQGVKDHLAKYDGADFDSHYMEMQMSLHHSALNLLDYTLIPRTKNDQLRQHLIEERMVVDQHLQQARAVYKSL